MGTQKIMDSRDLSSPTHTPLSPHIILSRELQIAIEMYRTHGYPALTMWLVQIELW